MLFFFDFPLSYIPIPLTEIYLIRSLDIHPIPSVNTFYFFIMIISSPVYSSTEAYSDEVLISSMRTILGGFLKKKGVLELKHYPILADFLAGGFIPEKSPIRMMTSSFVNSGVSLNSHEEADLNYEALQPKLLNDKPKIFTDSSIFLKYRDTYFIYLAFSKESSVKTTLKN